MDGINSTDWDKEWLKCHLSPSYFVVTYGSFLDEVGYQRFIPLPHLMRILSLFEENRLLVLLKARQVAVTWLFGHLILWDAMFHQGANVIVLSKSEIAAEKTISYAKFILRHLPNELKLPVLRDQTSFISFPSTDSEIHALSSTPTSGIGFGRASLVILDEFDFHDYADQNYIEILPMLSSGSKSKMIIGSAPNVLKPDSKFKEIYRQAKQGINNFVPYFIPFNVIPGHDDVWYENERKNYNTLEMVTRNPRTEQEALTSAKDLCRFDVPSLQELINDAKTWQPLEVRQNGIVKIYKKSVAGRKYCFAIDPARGGGDPSVGLVFDWQTSEEVAEFCGKISVDEQARIAWDLYKEYNEAYCASERNADGERLIEKLQGFGVKNFYYDLNDKKHEKPGWWTSGHNRPIMIGELADSIARKDVRLHNPVALEQFFYFVRTDRKPEGEATKGANDDYVMATAIAMQIRKSMPSGEGVTVYHSQYRG